MALRSLGLLLPSLVGQLGDGIGMSRAGGFKDLLWGAKDVGKAEGGASSYSVSASKPEGGR